MTTGTLTARDHAGRVIRDVLSAGHSLSQVLPPVLAQSASAERGFTQELCYGVLRWRFRLERLLGRLLRQPLKAKDQDVQALLLTGLYQLAFTSVAPHAAVHETVEAVRRTGKRWAVPVTNAVLRAYQRRQAELDAEVDQHPEGRFAHPAWLIDRIRTDWPDAWEEMLRANNERPPFVLRVNRRKTDRSRYQQSLRQAGIDAHPTQFAADGLYLPQPVPVDQLPGFAEGEVSVQDGAAQLAAVLLNVRAGMRVLDACAAPGGKAAHILECCPGLTELVALDIDADRTQRVQANLQRLGLQATVCVGDAADPQAWCDGRRFDRILLDAPCSATGVIRRHPDIKSLRRSEDIDALAGTQSRLLDAVWPLLAPGGMLLYATCSVLRAENEEQIARFIARHAEAREQILEAEWGVPCRHGRQILPGAADASTQGSGMDGFFYACLTKRTEGC